MEILENLRIFIAKKKYIKSRTEAVEENSGHNLAWN
jgi:hypothetical protein